MKPTKRKKLKKQNAISMPAVCSSVKWNFPLYTVGAKNMNEVTCKCYILQDGFIMLQQNVPSILLIGWCTSVYTLRNVWNLWFANFTTPSRWFSVRHVRFLFAIILTFFFFPHNLTPQLFVYVSHFIESLLHHFHLISRCDIFSLVSLIWLSFSHTHTLDLAIVGSLQSTISPLLTLYE